MHSPEKPLFRHIALKVLNHCVPVRLAIDVPWDASRDEIKKLELEHHKIKIREILEETY